jgi:hypothetical protein
MTRSTAALVRHLQTPRSRPSARPPSAPVRDRYSAAYALGWRPLR